MTAWSVRREYQRISTRLFSVMVLEHCNAYLQVLGCEIAVHQNCYGIRHIPEGSWNCVACTELGPGPNKLKCTLCGATSGAFKKDDSGEWVHVQCALYVSVSHPFLTSRHIDCPFEGKFCFGSPRKSLVTQRSPSKMKCIFCKSSFGTPVRCSYSYAVLLLLLTRSGCSKTFHVTCGQKARLVFISPVDTGDKSLHFCWDHTPVDRKQTQIQLRERDAER